MSIRIFVSYSHIDREMAGEFKKNLESFGFDVFLAHDDIEPSEDWQNTILYELGEMDVFLPLLTSNYKESDWTDQESGIAAYRRILVIPLKVDIPPYGFLSKPQALKVDVDDIHGDCVKIVETISKRDHLREKLRRCVIAGFGKSISFDDAKLKSEYLLLFSPFSEREINEILLSAGQNTQIHGSFSARKNIEKLMDTHKKIINPDLVDHFVGMTKRWDKMVG